MKKLSPLGIDDGHAMVNVYGEFGQSVTVNSRVRQGAADNLAIGSEPNLADGVTIEVNGNNYSCGRVVNSAYLDTRTDQFPGSEQNIALIAYGIALFYKGEIPQVPIDICTGLPMGVYFPDVSKMVPNRALIERKNKAIMESEVFVIIGSKRVQVKFGEVITRPECMMAIYDKMIVESQHQGNESFVKRVNTKTFDGVTACYLDIGGRTTELALFDGNNLIGGCSGSYSVGALTVTDKLRGRLKAEHGELSSKRIDEMMKFFLEFRNEPTAKFTFQRKTLDIIPMINEILEGEMVIIKNFINSKISSRADQIDVFEIFGGGQYLYGPLLEKALEQYPLTLSEEPELVNARSCYKFMRYGRK